MQKTGYALLITMLLACGNNKVEVPESEDGTSFQYGTFSQKFPEAVLPYTLSDTALLQNRDTAVLRNPVFATYLSDSLRNKIFGSAKDLRYTAMARMLEKEGDAYYVVKVQGTGVQAAILYVFDNNGVFGSAFPLLVPDKDPRTQQVSSIDKSFSITRSLSRRISNDETEEGKDVHIYNQATKGFTLIMTDVLDDSSIELINPIDTFPRSHLLAGDYTRDKQNLVSIRDGASNKEISFFIHFEKGADCSGELKGTALLTTSKTAVFRQPGNPCVLELHFTSSAVTLHEVEGCGSNRGARCLFEGSFPKKKDARKNAPAKKKRKAS